MSTSCGDYLSGGVITTPVGRMRKTQTFCPNPEVGIEELNVIGSDPETRGPLYLQSSPSNVHPW